MPNLVVFSRAEKNFLKFSKVIQEQVWRAFDELEKDPLNQKVKKLRNSKRGYRMRVGKYRILFTFLKKEKEVQVVDIFMKKSPNDYLQRRKLIF